MSGIESHFEINVSYRGQHLFATDARSCVSEAQMVRVVRELKARFPEDNGWRVEVTHWSCSGRSVRVTP